MAKLLTRRVKTGTQAGGVNPAQEPNVSQYGWTGAETANILRILEYVNVSKKYSEESTAAAMYTRDLAEDVNDSMNGAIKASKGAQGANEGAQAAHQAVSLLADAVDGQAASIQRMYDELVNMYPNLGPVIDRVNDLEKRVAALEAKP